MSELSEALNRFIDGSSSDYMPDAASELLELLESDAVEPINAPGKPVAAEEYAERLEEHMARVRRRTDDSVDGLDLIEDAVAHLRAREGDTLDPWTFEDGEGVRWFVLRSRDDIVACYTSRPFIEADV